MFFLSHRSVTVSYSVFISILLLFLLPSKELPVRIKMNKQESSSKLFSQFSPTPVGSVILLMFSQKGVIILPGSLPSHCAGLQLVTRPSHRKEEHYLTGLEPLLFRNSTHEEIDRSVTVSKPSGFAFMVKSICLYM